MLDPGESIGLCCGTHEQEHMAIGIGPKQLRESGSANKARCTCQQNNRRLHR
jgi:hypothetical protein